jgi:acetoin utilization deacetylase AcuC-like enzyme
MIVLHDPGCAAYHRPGHPERPARVVETARTLREQAGLDITWEIPEPAGDDVLLLAHTPNHLLRVGNAGDDFDADTPCYPGIDQHARLSVGAALSVGRHALAGRTAFSLMRPPGHHAEKERVMGFCYYNQAAICALAALHTSCTRVAVFDFDVHHGNGTENILLGHDDTLYASVHEFPTYPGTGRISKGNCLNYPVAPGAAREVYREACREALDRIHHFRPDLLVVSAGFDASLHDPLGQQNLEEADFWGIGNEIRQLGIPFCSILEGGYSDQLPGLILAYLHGCEGIQLHRSV